MQMKDDTTNRSHLRHLKEVQQMKDAAIRSVLRKENDRRIKPLQEI